MPLLSGQVLGVRWGMMGIHSILIPYLLFYPFVFFFCPSRSSVAVQLLFAITLSIRIDLEHLHSFCFQSSLALDGLAVVRSS